jgi:ADP-ribose pyrophosphatase
METPPIPHPFDWRVLNSRYIVHDRWLGLRADACQVPSGAVLDPYYILELPDYINVVAITPRQEVVLVREYRHGAAQTILELPSGRVDAGEDALVAAQRELLEETGFSGPAFQHLCTLSPNPANHTNRVYSFLATGVEHVQEMQPDASEQIEVVLLPLAQVIEMLYANQFIQAMHASALFYALRRLDIR